MVIPYAAGTDTMALLNEQKQPNVINNNKVYVPLDEKQADLYMGTEEYTDELDLRASASFVYFDSNKKICPISFTDVSTGEIHKITLADAEKLIDNNQKATKKQDKVILMTKGIGGLPEPMFKGVASKTHLIATSIVWFPCCFPCSIALWYKLYKQRDNPRLKGSDGKTYPSNLRVTHEYLNKVNAIINKNK